MAAPDDGKMGLPMTTAFVIGNIVGVAIFMLPVALAPLGINAIIGWLISSVGAICLGLPLAKLARGGAGIQAAVEETFGTMVGLVVTWAFWVSSWAGLAAIAVGAASAISPVIPVLANPWNVALLSAILIGLTASVNTRGARASGAMAIVIALLRILPLSAVVILVAVKASAHESLQPLWAQPITLSSVAAGTALTLYAFVGFESVTAPVGKIRDPNRVIPSALVLGLTTVTFFYLTTSTSVMLLLPADQLVRSPAPFADAVGASWGEMAATLMVIGIAMSAFGCIGCTAMQGGELCYSMALRGDIPKALAWTNSRGAPVLSQLISAGLAIILVLSNASRSTAGLYTFIILLAEVAVLILYVVAALAMWVRERSLASRTLVLIGIFFAAFAFYGSGLEASLWGLGLAASALPVRAISRWLSASSRDIVAVGSGPEPIS
jgi:basic amino acid/polyamine antiporter, APA family